jgi:hypothetical protein
MNKAVSERHLTDAELFALAAPAAGEPEALPAHLLQCPSCSRALQEWKEAVQDLARADVRELAERTPEEWRLKEEATMEAIRRAGRPGRGRRPLRWVIGIAASLLIVALAMPRREAPTAAATSTGDTPAALSPADQEDDALLRDAAYLAQGGDESSDIALEESL